VEPINDDPSCSVGQAELPSMSIFDVCYSPTVYTDSPVQIPVPQSGYPFAPELYEYYQYFSYTRSIKVKVIISYPRWCIDTELIVISGNTG
jgi:hypothetical protein